MNTESERNISSQDLQELYHDNQQALANSSVKFVVLSLGQHSSQYHPFKNRFMDAARNYELPNVQFCQAVYSRSLGSFDNDDINEYHAQLLPLD